MNEPTHPRRGRPWLRIALTALPIWLVASAGVALWWYFQREAQRGRELSEAFAREVSAQSLAADVMKITSVIGERNRSTDAARANLTRIASMIEGTLGPSNTGYPVRRIQSALEWPLLLATLPGNTPSRSAVWVICAYDSLPGSRGVEANATGIATSLAAAQALVGDSLMSDVHFLFAPHANDPESPVMVTIASIAGMIRRDDIVLCVEAMGAGETLWFSSRNTNAPALRHTSGLGDIRGAEVVCLGEDNDIASRLFQSGLPAVRVATRPIVLASEADASPPDPATLAASAGRLVEFIRRCADLP